MPFYPSWVIYLDDAAKGEAREPMSRTDARWAIESIREVTDARKNLAAEHDLMRASLQLIAGDRCRSFTGGTRCWDMGRIRGARCTADAWCDACVAYAALARVRDGLITTTETEEGTP